MYFKGLGNTLLIALFAGLLGIVIGVFLAMVKYVNKKTGKLKFLTAIANLYITIIRGTPVVLQLFIMYFIVMVSVKNGIVIGAITFGLNSGAYVAEIVRAGFESVDDGQMEAGRSLGLSTGQTMFKIITPQAVRNVMPPLFNEFIMLVKETAIVGYVGILDLGKVPGLIQSVTFDYLFPLLISAVMYLIVVLILTGVLKLIEKQLAKGDRGNYKKINVRKNKKFAYETSSFGATENSEIEVFPASDDANLIEEKIDDIAYEQDCKTCKSEDVQKNDVQNESEEEDK